MPYYIVQFVRPRKHRPGQTNRDVTRIGPLHPSQHKAEMALAALMDRNRVDGQFVRIDWNVSPNAVAYGDLRSDGGVVRLRQRDGVHYASAMTLARFKERLAKVEQRHAVLGNAVRETTQP